MQTVRIFISSPGDVATERERAREVVDRLQSRYAGHLRLQPVLWEDMPLGAGASFQEGIDLLISDEHAIDIAVFILWSRLGSPLGADITREDGSPYRSGTEREFDVMLKARERNNGRPDILVYVRRDEEAFRLQLMNESKDNLANLIDQRRLAQSFIEEHFHDVDSGTNTRAYHTFDKPVSFANRLRVHLQQFLDGILEHSTADHVVWDVQSQGSPYRGLQAFGAEHASVFFGRESQELAVQERLRSQAAAGTAFVLVVGASGSGKSSLIRAGVLPAITSFGMDDESTNWLQAVLVPGEHQGDLCGGLARALADCLPGLATSDLARITKGLREGPETTVDLAIAPAIEKASADGRSRLLLVVDQLEELFTQTEIAPAELAAFVQAIGTLARSGHVWVLATVRSDFFAQCQQLPGLVELIGESGMHNLLAPGPEDLRHIIRDPARLAGLRFEEKADGATLDAAILAEALENPEALPLLSYLLSELFETCKDQGVLTFAAYEALGGVGGALGVRAEAVYRTLSSTASVALPSVLQALVTVREDDVATRRRAPVARVADTPARSELVDTFVAERLLVTDRGPDGEAIVSVAHEALLREWERAVQWINENRDFLRIRARVAAAEIHWQAEGRADDLLLPAGKPLAEAEALAQTYSEGLDPALADYIQRSTDHHAVIAQRQLKRLRLAVAGFAVLAVLAVAGGAFAWHQSGVATTALGQAEVAQVQAETDRDAAVAATDEATRAKQAVEVERDKAEAATDNFRDLSYQLARQNFQQASTAQRHTDAVLWRLEALRIQQERGADTVADLLAISYEMQYQPIVRWRSAQGWALARYIQATAESPVWFVDTSRFMRAEPPDFAELVPVFPQISEDLLVWPSPDQRHALFTSKATVGVLDTISGELTMLRLPDDGEPGQICGTWQDGSRFYVTRGRQVYAGRVGSTTLEPRWTLQTPADTSMYSMVVWDEKRLVTQATVDGSKLILAYDLASGEEWGRVSRIVGNHTSGCLALVGHTAVFGGSGPPGQLVLLDLSASEFQARQHRVPGDIYSLRKLDDRTFEYQRQDGNLERWNTQGERLSVSLLPTAEQMLAQASLPSGDWRNVDSQIKRYAAGGERLLSETAAPLWAASVRTAGDGQLIVARGTSGEVVLMDQQTGRVTRRWTFPGTAQEAALSSDGSKLYVRIDVTLYCLDPENPDMENAPSVPVWNYGGFSFHVLPDDRGLIAIVAGNVSRLDATDLTVYEKLNAESPDRVAVDSAGVRMLYGRTRNKFTIVQRYDLATGRLSAPYHLAVDPSAIESVWLGDEQILLGMKDGSLSSTAVEFYYESSAPERGDVRELLPPGGEAITTIVAGAESLYVARSDGSLHVLTETRDGGVEQVAEWLPFGATPLKELLELADGMLILRSKGGILTAVTPPTSGGWNVPLPDSTQPIFQSLSRPDFSATIQGDSIDFTSIDVTMTLQPHGMASQNLISVRTNRSASLMLVRDSNWNAWLVPLAGDAALELCDLSSMPDIIGLEFVDDTHLVRWSALRLQIIDVSDPTASVIESTIELEMIGGKAPAHVAVGKDFIALAPETQDLVILNRDGTTRHHRRTSDVVRSLTVAGRDGGVLLAGAAEQVLQIDPRTGVEGEPMRLPDLPHTNYYTRSLCALPGQDVVAIGSKDLVYLMRVGDREPFMEVPVVGYTWLTQCSADGRSLYWQTTTQAGMTPLPDFSRAIDPAQVHRQLGQAVVGGRIQEAAERIEMQSVEGGE